jgi:PAS domain S-box-containing protein
MRSRSSRQTGRGVTTSSGPPQPADLGAGLFELLVKSVLDYAIFALDSEGRVATWNLGAERLKGYRADEIIGQHFSRFYPEDDVAAGKPERELADAVANGRVEDEGFRVRKDGSQFWANVVITALRDDHGELIGFAKVTRDLTLRKAAEDSLRESEERALAAAAELRRLDQMKNEFVAMVAHDLTSPLSVASGFVDVVLSRWDELSDDDKRDMLGRVTRTTTNLTSLVGDILAVGRIEAGELVLEKAAFDLALLLERAAVEATPVDSAERIRTTAAPGIPLAFGDERRTWQVVMNLLSNALKFSPDDAPIDVDVGIMDGALVTSVRDGGRGVAVADRERLFERFVRLSHEGVHARQGSGLGLYICKELIEAQGGRIWVDGEVGQGASFRFTLPMAHGEQ